MQIDSRIKEAMHGWRVEQIYKGTPVTIPGTWGAIIYPYKYFEIYKKEGDPNPGDISFVETADGSTATSEENEIQCYLSCGWKGTDDEVVIVLHILGANVLNGAQVVGAEIYKFGATQTKVYKDNKQVTDFIEKKLFGLIKFDTGKFMVKNVL